MISPEKIAEILAAAEKATAGAWKAEGHVVFGDWQASGAIAVIRTAEKAFADTKYIALCDPHTITEILSELRTLRAERDKLHAAMTKISAICDSIIGFQNVGWSEHIYPLVAALHEGGFDGIGYDKARKHVQATLDATKDTEARVLAAEAQLARQGEALKGVIAAWEATASGTTSVREIQRWLIEDMKPAIDLARSTLSPEEPSNDTP